MDAALDCVASFDRSCATASDCAVGERSTNCCGGYRAMGIAATEVHHFQSVEQTCNPSARADCGCLGHLHVTADDGTVNGDGGGVPQVMCLSGTCTTTFAP